MKTEVKGRFIPSAIESRLALAKEWEKQAKTIQAKFGILPKDLPSFPQLPEGFNPKDWHPVLVIPPTGEFSTRELLKAAGISSSLEVKTAQFRNRTEPFVVYVALAGYEKINAPVEPRDATVEELAAFVLHCGSSIEPGQHIFLSASSNTHYFKDDKTSGYFKEGLFSRYAPGDKTMRVVEVAGGSPITEKVLQKGIEFFLGLRGKFSNAPAPKPSY